MPATIAKVFMTGRSQAIRIPKKFRFSTSEVFVRKSGDSLVISPTQGPTWEEFFRDHACPDFTLDRTESQRPQERDLFG